MAINSTPISFWPVGLIVQLTDTYVATDTMDTANNQPTGTTKKYTISQLSDTLNVSLTSNLVSAVACESVNLVGSYANGLAGIGATLTNSGALMTLTIDTVSVEIGDRILLSGQSDQTQNGIYTVTVLGDSETPWILTRATDYDGHIPNQISIGDFIIVTLGSVNSLSTWIQTSRGPFVVGSTAINFAKQV